MINSLETISLDEAIKTESLRPKFLAGLLPKNIPYCRNVVYDADGSKITNYIEDKLVSLGIKKDEATKIAEQTMSGKLNKRGAGLPLISYFIGSGIYSDLFVGPRIFTGEYNEKEISHHLLAHDGTHLRQTAIGFPYFNTNEFKDAWMKNEIRPLVVANIAELDANYQSLLRVQSGEFQVRDECMRKLFHNYKLGIASLYNLRHDSKSEKEKKFIDIMLKFAPHTKSQNCIGL